jgi:murein DD-endopeptidase MepM/ murein hydrolase activator NlpD
MQRIWFSFFFLLGWVVSACSATATPATHTLTTEPVITETQRPPTTIPTLPPTVTTSPTNTVEIPTSLVETETPLSNKLLCSPLAEQSLWEIHEIVSDPYNPPPPGKDERHHGTDLAYYRRKDRLTNEGEGVQAILAGKVVASVQDQLPYGNMVIIETQSNHIPSIISEEFEILEDQSLYILYAHFGTAPLVDLGDLVICGQMIGDVGATGYNIVNPHLHFETRIGPTGEIFAAGMAYYDTRTTQEERKNYELWRTSGVFRHVDPMAIIAKYLESQVRE